MAAANCPTCGNLVDRSAEVCLKCGRTHFRVFIRVEKVPCPKCSGEGKLLIRSMVQIYPEIWGYRERQCPHCKGTGKLNCVYDYDLRDSIECRQVYHPDHSGYYWSLSD